VGGCVVGLVGWLVGWLVVCDDHPYRDTTHRHSASHTHTIIHTQCKLAGLAGEKAVKALEACLSASSLGSEASR
jgi:hypothetical protein